MANLEKNIQGADAFILMYSVTDKCSFDDCNRLKFLINYNKRRRKLVSNSKASICTIGCALIRVNLILVDSIEDQLKP